MALECWTSGWVVEDEGDHFEVCYTPTERMRIGADGSLSFGGPEPYVFQTREWAELCAQRLNSLDAAFGRGPFKLPLYSFGNLGIGTIAPNRLDVTDTSSWPVFQIHPSPLPKPVLSIAQGGQITRFDLPYFLFGWWRGTKAYRAWRVLMWGEKA